VTGSPESSEASIADFLARLGAAMIAANYPVNLVRRTLTRVADHYGLANHLVVLPNYIQLSGSDQAGAAIVRVVQAEHELRYDQTFPLADLVDRTEHGDIAVLDGLDELDRIHALPRRFPAWVNVIGYAVQSAGFALVLQPTPIALTAATGFGLLVGMLELLDRVSAAIGQLLPVISAFLVATSAFTLDRVFHLGPNNLRVEAAPLALFLPGVAITLAVIELTTREVVSGAARLIAGFMQLAQLAFGILIAAQLVGVSASAFVVGPVNKFGAWAPWVGVAVYGVGIWLYLGPPRKFTPWLLAILFVAYSGQVAANAVFGSYASGFGGGFTLMVCALAISQLPNSPPTAALLLPGFWLLIPGALGLVGVTQFIGADRGAVFTGTLTSMISIALGFQAGLLVWGAFHQLRDTIWK
jgi:uncharacterized membrane protein YjjP (DUF1212 family)